MVGTLYWEWPVLLHGDVGYIVVSQQNNITLSLKLAQSLWEKKFKKSMRCTFGINEAAY